MIFTIKLMGGSTQMKTKDSLPMKDLLERAFLGVFSLLLLSYGLVLLEGLNYDHQPTVFGGALLVTLIGLASFCIAVFTPKATPRARRES